MKRLFIALVLIVFLVVPAYAGECERYWDELVEQSFETTIEDVDYTLYFGGSVYGPCPGGVAVLSYTDVQTVNDVEYTAEIEADCSYATTTDIVTIGGLNFILFDGKLFLLPDDPLILDIVEEEY